MNTAYMLKAIQLAKKGWYTCMPNPRVGCVMEKNGEIVGEGWHQYTGQAHAEINALNCAGSKARGATVYVTLEPCSHKGKTDSCAQALVKAGIKRIIIGMQDPNPQVCGRGIEILRKAGIEVVSDFMHKEVSILNIGFIHRMRTKIPWVRCKMAMSMDGRTAMHSGESKWITCKDARMEVQKLRGESCAIITGIGSVLQDNPQMSFRPAEVGILEIVNRQPWRVIIDARLQTPLNAKILTSSGNILIACTVQNEKLRHQFLHKIKQFRSKYQQDKTEVLVFGNSNIVDLSSVLQWLGQQECNTVLIEAGAKLAGNAIDSQCVNELWIYMAPILMGSTAKPLFELPIDYMKDKKELCIKDVSAIGNDWRFIATFR